MLKSLNLVEQKRTFDFSFELSGPDPVGFATVFNVLQFPGDTPAITRAMVIDGTRYIGSITSVEMALLTISGPTSGQWWIHINAVDSDEDIADPIKLYVSRKWV